MLLKINFFGLARVPVGLVGKSVCGKRTLAYHDLYDSP